MKTRPIIIELRGVELEVEFDYSPYEEEVRYYKDGSGYPGSPEQVEITAITHKGVDFMEFMENEYDVIDELILKEIHDN